jgi:two-component system, cell cycle sensor histidine kinase and response regulator CckA
VDRATESSRAAALLRRLTQLSRAVSQAASLDAVLRLAVDQAAAILSADRAVLLLVGDDGQAHVRAAHGVDAELARQCGGPLDEEQIARIEQTLAGPEKRSFLAVPLIVQGAVTGLLAVSRADAEPWQSDDEAVLSALADQSAAPIEIARLSEEVQHARLLADNERLSSDLNLRVAELEGLLRVIPIGIAIADNPDCEVIRINPALSRMLGMEASKVTSYSANDAWRRAIRVNRDGREISIREGVVQTAADTGQVVEPCEMEVVWPDGRRLIMLASAAPVSDTNGLVRGAVGAFVDITDRRRMDEHLRQVQQMESVGRLAGGVAHEANNQMSVVLGAVHFILEQPDLPESVRDDARHIRRAAERTAAVTSQLLAFSRRQVLRPETLDLNLLVSELKPVLQRAMGEDCVLEWRPDPETGLVRADRGQLEQVFLNLALNARDAMPGPGQLTIETRPFSLEDRTRLAPDVPVRPGEYACITIADTGLGMSRETLSHLFEPFYTTKEVGKGTGLGLSTVYGTIKQSGGYVWATSELGEGTTFTILLPVTSVTPTLTPVTEQAGGSPAGETVLVVEDEAAVREMAIRGLRGAGYVVIEAQSGPEALRAVAVHQGPLDLIVTDVVMPGMSGRELVQELGRRGLRVPVLFISGYTDDEIIRRGLFERGRPFLSKPFSPQVLAARVGELLEHARQS